MSTGDWLILTRTKSLLNVPTYLKKKGFFLIQHKAIVLVKVLRRYQHWYNYKRK